MIQTFANRLFLLAIFLLPWQTQWIIDSLSIAGEKSQLGLFLLYITEVMILCVFLLRGRAPYSSDAKQIVKAVYFFLAVCFFSLSFSAFSLPGWFHMIHVVAAAVLFFVMVDERTSLKQILTAFLFGLFVPIFIGWIQVLFGASPDSTLLGIAAKDAATLGAAVVETDAGRLLRAYGTFPHPNIFGGYLAVGIIALTWLAPQIKSKRGFLAALLLTAALSSTLIITFSRSAWLAVFFALSIFVIFLVKHKKIPSHQVKHILNVGFMCALLTIIFFHTQVFSRFNPSTRLEAISIEERASQYQSFPDIFFSAPILGIGPNSYTFFLAAQNPGLPVWAYQPIHNTILLLLAELGIIGLSFFLFILFRITKPLFNTLPSSHAIFGMSLGLALLFISFFDHYLWTLWPGLALGALSLGLMCRWKNSS